MLENRLFPMNCEGHLKVSKSVQGMEEGVGCSQFYIFWRMDLRDKEAIRKLW